MEAEGTMEKVTSRDGTPIACHRRGAGPPLILIHAAGAANPLAWTSVTPVLEEHFTVYAVDRRGHGESGDGPTYALAREAEDIAAVVDSLGEPVNLLGHSFGGLCCLEAALLTRNIHKLVFYEPLSAPLPGKPVYPQGFIAQLQARMDAGDRERVLTMFYRVIAGLSPLEIEQLKASPAWPARLATAHTLPRELRADESYRFDARRFKELRTPTLLLAGGESRDFEKKGSELVAAALPEGRIAVLPGQGHLAMYMAPELFVREVLAFFIGPG
jgi:pimeloyl-ACP methyl ester carboxylesterase